jgi:hypothetical protein
MRKGARDIFDVRARLVVDSEPIEAAINVHAKSDEES